MNTVNAIKMLLIAGLTAAASPAAHAVVVDTGASSARDIFVNATVSASAAGLNLAAVNLGIPALNRASGSTAVDGPTYAKSPSATPSATVTSGLLSLTAEATLLEVSATSIGIGSPGSNSTIGGARIANAGASLNALAFNLLSVDLITPGSGTSVLSSYSEISGDGVGVTPFATSNLLSTSGAALSVSVLGIDLPVSLAGLSANATVVIPISLSVTVPLVSVTTITGSVTVRPDYLTQSFNGASATASATSLLLNFNLAINQSSPVTGSPILTANVQADVGISETIAAVTAVPEPSPLLGLTAVGAAGILRRRRR